MRKLSLVALALTAAAPAARALVADHGYGTTVVVHA